MSYLNNTCAHNEFMNVNTNTYHLISVESWKKGTLTLIYYITASFANVGMVSEWCRPGVGMVSVHRSRLISNIPAQPWTSTFPVGIKFLRWIIDRVKLVCIRMQTKGKLCAIKTYLIKAQLWFLNPLRNESTYDTQGCYPSWGGSHGLPTERPKEGSGNEAFCP